MTEDRILAAEYALGLLEGEELLAARAREASDTAFAADVVQWQDRLAPLADAIHPRLPRAEVWQRIEAQLSSNGGTANIVALQRSLRRWQWAGGLSAAAALILAFLALPQMLGSSEPAQGIAQGPTADQPILAANMPIKGTPLRLDFTYLPGEDSLLVGAVGLTADGAHDHEIWFVPPKGDLVSLGIVTPGKIVAHSVPNAVARALHDGSQLVLTREPLGGKPAGADAGPVVAEARFTTI